MKKRLAILALAALMIFTMVGCGAAKTEPKTDAAPAAETESAENAAAEKSSTQLEAKANTDTDVTAAVEETVNKAEPKVDDQTVAKTDGNAETKTATATANKASQLTQRTSASIAFVNETGADFYQIYFASSASDQWGEEWLGDTAPLEDGYTLTVSGRLKYTADDTSWDLLICDAEGNTLQWDCLDLTYASNPKEIVIDLYYNADRDTYVANVC